MVNAKFQKIDAQEAALSTFAQSKDFDFDPRTQAMNDLYIDRHMTPIIEMLPAVKVQPIETTHLGGKVMRNVSGPVRAPTSSKLAIKPASLVKGAASYFAVAKPSEGTDSMGKMSTSKASGGKGLRAVSPKPTIKMQETPVPSTNAWANTTNIDAIEGIVAKKDMFPALVGGAQKSHTIKSTAPVDEAVEASQE